MDARTFTIGASKLKNWGGEYAVIEELYNRSRAEYALPKARVEETLSKLIDNAS